MKTGITDNPQLLELLDKQGLALFQANIEPYSLYEFRGQPMAIGEDAPIPSPTIGQYKGAHYFTELYGSQLALVLEREGGAVIHPIHLESILGDMTFLCKDTEHQNIVHQIDSFVDKAKDLFRQNLELLVRDFHIVTRVTKDKCCKVCFKYDDKYMQGAEVEGAIYLTWSRDIAKVPSLNCDVKFNNGRGLGADSEVCAFSLYSMAEDLFRLCGHLDSSFQFFVTKLGKDEADKTVTVEAEVDKGILTFADISNGDDSGAVAKVKINEDGSMAVLDVDYTDPLDKRS